MILNIHLCSYGSLTLLFQDLVGGLEVQDKAGNFIPATPVPDTVVVNIGDLFQRYSNNVSRRLNLLFVRF